MESSLEYEQDSYQKYLIKKEIKKLKKEQKKYYVHSVLEMEVYNKRVNEGNVNTLEEYSFGLIKKF